MWVVVVWWIDRLPPVLREEDKYGLNTHMLSGVNKVVRYYSYFGPGFNLTKQLILSEVSSIDLLQFYISFFLSFNYIVVVIIIMF